MFDSMLFKTGWSKIDHLCQFLSFLERLIDDNDYYTQDTRL